MSKWFRRAVAILSVGMLFGFGGCGLGGLLNYERIVQDVVIASIFD